MPSPTSNCAAPQVTASRNAGTGVSIINDSRLQILSFPEAQGSRITAEGNGFAGIAVLGAKLGVVGSQYFGSGANVLLASGSPIGFFMPAGAILSPHATAKFVAQNNDVGMQLEDGASAVIIGGLQVKRQPHRPLGRRCRHPDAGLGAAEPVGGERQHPGCRTRLRHPRHLRRRHAGQPGLRPERAGARLVVLSLNACGGAVAGESVLLGWLRKLLAALRNFNLIVERRNMKTRRTWMAAAIVALAGTAQAALVSLGDGTVKDTNTNLIWLQDWNVNGQATWGTQMAWAENLTFASSSDWELPSIDEYSALFGAYGGLNLVNEFSNVQAVGYWSRSGVGSCCAKWAFNPASGIQFPNDPIGAAFAVAVRPGDVTTRVPEPQTLALALLALGRDGGGTQKAVTLRL